jgi:hypothetical protein
MVTGQRWQSDASSMGVQREAGTRPSFRGRGVFVEGSVSSRRQRAGAF